MSDRPAGDRPALNTSELTPLERELLTRLDEVEVKVDQTIAASSNAGMVLGNIWSQATQARADVDKMLEHARARAEFLAWLVLAGFGVGVVAAARRQAIR